MGESGDRMRGVCSRKSGQEDLSEDKEPSLQLSGAERSRQRHRSQGGNELGGTTEQRGGRRGL